MIAPAPGAAPGPFTVSRSLALSAAGILLVSAAGAAGVSALSGGSSSPGRSQAQAEVTAVPAAQAASFSILRRRQRPADAFATLMAGSGPMGANPALARTAVEPRGGLSAGAVSVVPAAGAICLRIPFPQGGAFWECQPLAQALRGRLIAAVRPPGPLGDGRQLLVGLVPDGVRAVTVTIAGGAQRRLTVHTNLYDVEVRSPRAIAIAIPGAGTRRYPAP